MEPWKILIKNLAEVWAEEDFRRLQEEAGKCVKGDEDDRKTADEPDNERQCAA